MSVNNRYIPSNKILSRSIIFSFNELNGAQTKFTISIHFHISASIRKGGDVLTHFQHDCSVHDTESLLKILGQFWRKLTIQSLRLLVLNRKIAFSSGLSAPGTRYIIHIIEHICSIIYFLRFCRSADNRLDSPSLWSNVSKVWLHVLMATSLSECHGSVFQQCVVGSQSVSDKVTYWAVWVQLRISIFYYRK